MKRLIFALAVLLSILDARDSEAQGCFGPGCPSSGSSSSEIITKGGVFLAPSGASDIVVWRAPYACTVSKIQVFTVGGTSATINAMKGASDLLASDLVGSAGTWNSSTTIQNASFAVDDALTVQIISLSGSPTAVTIQVECTR
jgi:hypothetical protein